MGKLDKKNQTTCRVLSVAKTLVTLVSSELETRYEAIAALKAALVVVKTFPGPDQDPDAMAQ